MDGDNLILGVELDLSDVRAAGVDVNTAVNTTISPALQKTGKEAATIVHTTGDAIKATANKAKESESAVTGLLVRFLTFEKVIQYIRLAYQAMDQMATKTVQTGKDFEEQLGSARWVNLKDDISKIVDYILSGFLKAFGSTFKIISDMIDEMTFAFQNMFYTLDNQLKTLANSETWTKLKGLWGGIKGVLSGQGFAQGALNEYARQAPATQGPTQDQMAEINRAKGIVGLSNEQKAAAQTALKEREELHKLALDIHHKFNADMNQLIEENNAKEIARGADMWDREIARMQWEMSEEDRIEAERLAMRRAIYDYEKMLQEEHNREILERQMSFQAAIAGLIDQTFGSLVTSSAQMLGQALAGENIKLRAFFGQLLTQLGSAMIAVGFAIMAIGAALASLFTLNPFAMIGAGAALVVAGFAAVAFGSYLSATVRGAGVGYGGGGSASGTGGLGGGAVTISRPAYGSDKGDAAGGGTTNVTINYGPLVGKRTDGPEMARAVVSGINEHSGRAAGWITADAVR